MCAVPNMAVFCSSLTSWIPGTLLRYFLNDFEMVPVAPIITGITFVFTFHMCCISIVRFLYFKIFSASFLITFLSPAIATSKHTNSLLIVTYYDVWCVVGEGSVCLHLLIPQYGYLASLASFYLFWYNFTPVSLHMLKCIIIIIHLYADYLQIYAWNNVLGYIIFQVFCSYGLWYM